MTRKTGRVAEYRFYGCAHRFLDQCDYTFKPSELLIERNLLARIEDDVREKIKQIESARNAPKKKPKTNVKRLKEQLRRLEVVYMAGNKSDEEYISEAAAIKKKIQAAEQENDIDVAEVDTSKLQAFLDSNFKEAYNKMPNEQKQVFWRGLVEKIHMDGKNIKSVDLFF